MSKVEMFQARGQRGEIDIFFQIDANMVGFALIDRQKAPLTLDQFVRTKLRNWRNFLQILRHIE